jgi:hypothetical protein
MGDGCGVAVPHSVNDAGADVTLLVNDDLADAAAPAPRHRRWPWVVALVFVLALVAAGTSAVVYAHTYSPLAPGELSFSPVGHARAVTDGISIPTRYIVVGPPGSQGVVTYSVRNNGHHSVKILGADMRRSASLFPVTSVTWSPTVGPKHNTIDGRFKGSRPFPVTLYVTVTKPRCQAHAIEEIDGIPLRTESLWVHHIWQLPLSAGGIDDNFAPIDLCSPNSALEHLSTR